MRNRTGDKSGLYEYGQRGQGSSGGDGQSRSQNAETRAQSCRRTRGRATIDEEPHRFSGLLDGLTTDTTGLDLQR